MKRKFILLLCSFALTSISFSQIHNHWRGPARDGIYPEKNLLKEWPANGPEIAWVYEGLNAGFSSPVIANGKIYVTGMNNNEGFIYVLSMDGKLLKTFSFGPEASVDYPGSRVSPTVVDDKLYIASSSGRLVCMDANDGSTIWTLEHFSDFDGKNIRWGYTENIIIDGDTLYTTPGGRRHNAIALNRHTGELIWSSPGKGDVSAYNSPLLFNHKGRKILATNMAKNAVGFDARTGELLWSHPFQNRWDVHPNTPVYHDGGIAFFSGYGTGAIKFKISDDGASISQEWENKTFDNQMGGAVFHNGYLFGSGHNNRFWYCVDWYTGNNLWRSRELAQGPVVMADGMLYIYSERGEIALVEPSSLEFIIKGQGTVTHGTAQHWAHPVVHNGILYIRHGDALVAYKVRE